MQERVAFRVLVVLVSMLAAAAFAAAPPAEAQGGGEVCTLDSECEANEFCARREGRCDRRGRCTVRPEVCPQIFDPVCGCNGVTYSNSCFAAMAGVSVAAQGACEAQACTRDNQCASGFFCQRTGGNCEGPGLCALQPEFCILIFDPVCGCDNRTYGNACLAAAAGVSVASLGPCPEERCRSNEDCAPGSFCLRPGKSCNGAGRCEPQPELCPEIFDPVCGCDRQVYSNECFAAAAGVNTTADARCPDFPEPEP